ncbi:MAG: ferredoxin family protein [Planctomycetaceae bacterium]
MAKKITVVISQAQGKNPVKRHLEEELATRLMMEPGVDVSVVPHLYDMTADHTGMLFLRSVRGPLVVLSWLYPRGARWTLDRQGVRGKEGISLLVEERDDEDEALADDGSDEQKSSEAIGSIEVPNRPIYCIDLRVETKAEPYLQEIRRIHRDNSEQLVDLLGWIGGTPQQPQMERYLNPLPIITDAPSSNGNGSHLNGHAVNGTSNGHPLKSVAETNGHPVADGLAVGGAEGGTEGGEEGESRLLNFADDEVKRRWYPVIDYSRCTNCMECIDFCLFGVYGTDPLDRILVEAQDNCKKGCPACSRVCPENAIIFPQHKNSAIAGAEGEVAGFKIDLTKLFGGEGKDAFDLAIAERDNELVRDGRDAVGATVGVPRRQCEKSDRPRDDLDALMDNLDALDV